MILHIDTAYYPQELTQTVDEERRNGKGNERGFLFLFIMSFGQHAYQHRYFKDGVRNRFILSPLSRNSPLPIANHRTYQSIEPVYYSPIKPQNLIIYTNAISQYNPAVFDEYNDYIYNSILLDSYKKDADYYRKYRRFGTINDYYDSLPPLRRIKTELPYVQPVVPASHVVYINKDNPEVLVNLQKCNDVLASRIKQVEKEKERMYTQVLIEKQQARGYKKRYNKLKNRLKDEIGDRRAREMQVRQRRELDLQRQKQKVEQIQQAMLEVSRQLNSNSKILEENIKLKDDLQHEKEKEKVILFPTVPTVLTRSIVMSRPKLDSQYKEMCRLKRQISDIDKKLSNTFKY